VGVLLVGTPTGAIETATFGLDVAEESEDGRLHISVAAGTTARRDVLLWNKRPEPLRLRLSVAPAVVDGTGRAALGGTDIEPVEWVEVPETVDLRPEERRRVTIEVRAPRKIDAATRSVAIVAEPVAAEGSQPPAVVERLALTTYLEPDEGSLIASLGPFPWIALAVLVVVGALALRAAARRRRDKRLVDEE